MPRGNPSPPPCLMIPRTSAIPAASSRVTPAVLDETPLQRKEHTKTTQRHKVRRELPLPYLSEDRLLMSRPGLPAKIDIIRDTSKTRLLLRGNAVELGRGANPQRAVKLQPRPAVGFEPRPELSGHLVPPKAITALSELRSKASIYPIDFTRISTRAMDHRYGRCRSSKEARSPVVLS